MSRTPGPWEISRVGHMIYIEGKGRTAAMVNDQGFDISEETAEANAEFIVRACNQHERLVATLKDCAKKFREYQKIVASGGYPTDTLLYAVMCEEAVK